MPPRVLWTHAMNVVPKPSLFRVGSTTFLLPRLLSMLSGCEDMDSCLVTSKTIIHTPKEGAEAL